jgi:predicted kinase
MKKLIIMAGLPGSGKSTYVKENLMNEKNIVHIDSDETRKQMYGTYLRFPKNMYDIYDQMIVEGNKIYDKYNDLTLIMDSTFLENYRRNYYIDHLKKFDYYEIIMFHTNDIKFNLENNKKRIKDKRVPEDVILKMVDLYEPLDDATRKRFDKVVDIYVG